MMDLSRIDELITHLKERIPDLKGLHIQKEVDKNSSKILIAVSQNIGLNKDLSTKFYLKINKELKNNTKLIVFIEENTNPKLGYKICITESGPKYRHHGTVVHG